MLLFTIPLSFYDILIKLIPVPYASDYLNRLDCEIIAGIINLFINVTLYKCIKTLYIDIIIGKLNGSALPNSVKFKYYPIRRTVLER